MSELASIGSIASSEIPRLGNIFHCVASDISTLTDSELSIASQIDPPDSSDRLLQDYIAASPIPLTPVPSAWRKRVQMHYSVTVALKRYKPIDRKVCPVPSYMPNPFTQKFKPIAIPELMPLPIEPRP